LGTTVTITGTGFSTTAADDTVYFNGHQAVVTSATATQLVVTVPAQAGTGSVTANVPGGSANGPVFTYDYTYVVSTLAGGASTIVDGTGANAGFGALNGLTIDGNGNLYLGDMSTDKIKMVTSQGIVSTFAGSSFVTVDADGSLTTAAFATPADVKIDGSGTIYVLDAGSGLNGASIRKISGGMVTTIAGGGTKGSADGTGTAATFGNAWGLAIDGNGNFYVADATNNKIRKVTPAGVVTTFAGSGGIGSYNATGTSANFHGPVAVVLDGAGNLYVADEGNNLIREITPAGVVTTFAGSGTAGSTDGTGTAASFNLPSGLAIDNSGNIFVADMGSNKIRKITPAGVVTTIAGASDSGGYTDGPGSTALFEYPVGISVDSNGNIYVADTGENVVRKLSIQ
jgi:sugar lactone lactonase YvrE